MKKTKHRTKMKLGKSERGLKIVAVVVSDLCGSDVVSDDFCSFQRDER